MALNSVDNGRPCVDNTNMRIPLILTFLGLSSAAALFGASPVAQVIGTESITVAGISAPARNFVPLAPGDDVATQNGTAVVQFRDGSNVTLQSNSVLRVEGQAGSPVVGKERQKEGA